MNVYRLPTLRHVLKPIRARQNPSWGGEGEGHLAVLSS